MMHSSTEAGSMPARATASRTTSAPSCGAVKSFRPPRNFPVGVRTAETMTDSRILTILRTNLLDRIGPQQVLHLREDGRRRAGDFLPPPIVARCHEQDPLTQIDVRDARQRRPDSELPGKVGLLFGRRLATNNLRDDSGRKGLDGLHSSYPSARHSAPSIVARRRAA